MITFVMYLILKSNKLKLNSMTDKFIELFLIQLKKVDNIKMRKFILYNMNELLDCRTKDDFDSFFNKNKLNADEELLYMKFFNELVEVMKYNNI